MFKKINMFMIVLLFSVTSASAFLGAAQKRADAHKAQVKKQAEALKKQQKAAANKSAVVADTNKEEPKVEVRYKTIKQAANKSAVVADIKNNAPKLGVKFGDNFYPKYNDKSLADKIVNKVKGDSKYYLVITEPVKVGDMHYYKLSSKAKVVKVRNTDQYKVKKKGATAYLVLKDGKDKNNQPVKAGDVVEVTDPNSKHSFTLKKKKNGQLNFLDKEAFIKATKIAVDQPANTGNNSSGDAQAATSADKVKFGDGSYPEYNDKSLADKIVNKVKGNSKYYLVITEPVKVGDMHYYKLSSEAKVVKVRNTDQYKVKKKGATAYLVLKDGKDKNNQPVKAGDVVKIVRQSSKLPFVLKYKSGSQWSTEEKQAFTKAKRIK